MSASCRLPMTLLMMNAVLLTLALLLPGAARAKSLFEKDHPQVAQATEAYGRGDYEAALQLYEAAKESFEVPPAELHFNIGDTLVRLGRHEEAKQAYERALGAADGEFKADSFYNLGNAFLGLDEKDGAKAAYRQALKINPAHEPARRNLELLLRGKPPEQNQQCDNPSDGGEQPDAGEEDASESQDGGDPDAGQEESEDGGQSDASQEDAGEEEDATAARTTAMAVRATIPRAMAAKRKRLTVVSQATRATRTPMAASRTRTRARNRPTLLSRKSRATRARWTPERHPRARLRRFRPSPNKSNARPPKTCSTRCAAMRSSS